MLPVDEARPYGYQEEDASNQATKCPCVQRHPWPILYIFLRDTLKQVIANVCRSTQLTSPVSTAPRTHRLMPGAHSMASSDAQAQALELQNVVGL